MLDIQRISINAVICATVFALLNGCIFSHESSKEILLSKGYFLSAYQGGNTLIYHSHPEDLPIVVLSKFIDSVSWNEDYILGHAENAYFFVAVNEELNVHVDLVNIDSFLNLKRKHGLRNDSLKLDHVNVVIASSK